MTSHQPILDSVPPLIRHHNQTATAIHEDSVFERAWSALDPSHAGELPLYKLYDLLRMLEIELLGNQQASYFFTHDPIISHHLNRTIKELEATFERYGNELLVSKQDMFRLVESILEDIKIFDYDTMKLYGDFDDYHNGSSVHYYQDNYDNLIEKGGPKTEGFPDIEYDATIDALVTQVEDMLAENQTSDDEGDYDDTASLMETAQSDGSPSTLYDKDADLLDDVGISKKSSLDLELRDSTEKFSGFELKKSLEDLQHFHTTLESKFRSFEIELNQMSYQNNHDFKNLISLNKHNNRMIERVGSLRSEMMSISCQLSEIKRPGSTEVIKSHAANPPLPKPVDVTTTTNTPQDHAFVRKIISKKIPEHEKFIGVEKALPQYIDGATKISDNSKGTSKATKSADAFDPIIVTKETAASKPKTEGVIAIDDAVLEGLDSKGTGSKANTLLDPKAEVATKEHSIQIVVSTVHDKEGQMEAKQRAPSQCIPKSTQTISKHTQEVSTQTLHGRTQVDTYTLAIIVVIFAMVLSVFFYK